MLNYNIVYKRMKPSNYGWRLNLLKSEASRVLFGSGINYVTDPFFFTPHFPLRMLWSEITLFFIPYVQVRGTPISLPGPLYMSHAILRSRAPGLYCHCDTPLIRPDNPVVSLTALLFSVQTCNDVFPLIQHVAAIWLTYVLIWWRQQYHHRDMQIKLKFHGYSWFEMNFKYIVDICFERFILQAKRKYFPNGLKINICLF